VLDNEIAEDKYKILNAPQYRDRAMRANHYVTGGTAANRERRDGDEPDCTKPAQPKKFRPSKKSLPMRGNAFYERMFSDDEVKAAAEVDLAGTEKDRLREVACSIVVLAARVARNEVGTRRRKKYADLVPKFGLVPALPATFQGHVKPTGLTTIVQLEAELRARGIAFQSRSEGGAVGLSAMRELLKDNGAVNSDGFLIDGVMGLVSETALAIAQTLNSDDAFDALESATSDYGLDEGPGEEEAVGGEEAAKDQPRRSSRAAPAPERYRRGDGDE
jgi:hypothetical protein